MIISPFPALSFHPNLLVHRLGHPKDRHHDVDRTVTLIPQAPQSVQSQVDIALLTCTQHLLDDDRMRLIAHLEDIVWADEVETRVCGLQVVDCLSHVAFGRKDKSCKSFIRVRYLRRSTSQLWS